MINHELLLINNMAKFKQQRLNKKEDTIYSILVTDCFFSLYVVCMQYDGCHTAIQLRRLVMILELKSTMGCGKGGS